MRPEANTILLANCGYDRLAYIRGQLSIHPVTEMKRDLSPGRPKVEGRRPIRSTGEREGGGGHLKDAFISLPFEQNLPRGLMLRLLSFNGLLIVQHPGPVVRRGGRGIERCPRCRFPKENREKWTRGEFSSTFFGENFFLSLMFRTKCFERRDLMIS